MKFRAHFPSLRQSGFTLMELVIVVVVIGIIAGMAVPSFISYLPKLKVKAEAKDIVSKLRLARSKAVAERKPFGVAFDVSDDTYVYFADTDDPASSQFSTSDSALVSDTLDPNIGLVSCTYANNCVIFNSTGAASSSGDLQLVTDDGDILMSINVLASTGRVRLTEIGSS